MVVGTGAGCATWLVFFNTRCCNINFFKWLFTEAVIEAIRNVCKIYDELASLQLDGEPVLTEVLQIMETNKTVVSKLPASTTEASQPCDRGNLFKGSKTKLKYIKDRDINKENSRGLVAELCKVIEQHRVRTIQEQKQRSSPQSQVHEMTENIDETAENIHETAENISETTPLSIEDEDSSVEYKPLPNATAVINGLLRVHAAISKSCTKHTAQESFAKTGIFPFDPNRIFDNCTTTTEPTEREAVITALPALGEVIGEKGELLGEDIVQLTGLDLSAASAKDNLVVYRRRSILLTNPQFVAKQQAKIAEKLAQANEKLANKKAKVNKAPSENPTNIPKRRGRKPGSKNNNMTMTIVQA